MITFLFWNINGSNVQDLLASLADEHRVDIIILAECEIPARVLLATLNQSAKEIFHLPEGRRTKITILSRFSRQFLTTKFETERYSIRRLNLPERPEILLSAIHFPSKLYFSEESQLIESTELAKRISEVESEVGHRRTLLVGDFNMNPYEKGLVSAGALHATMSRRVAQRKTRTVQGNEYRFFYNPMWGHLGDKTVAPPGTYYYERAEHVNYFWNAFDQVLIRPELIDSFPVENLRILTAAGGTSLVSETGIPEKNLASDHLPLVFTLDV